jgi:4,5-DOPA dioxygenase extradiol
MIVLALMRACTTCIIRRLALPKLARQAADLLHKAGMQAKTVVDRGYDHGTWVPLMLLFPQADIPIVQLSVQPQAGAAHHFNPQLREFFHGGYRSDSLPPDRVRAFGAWVQEKVEAGAVDDIANDHLIAPYAVDNHPGEEHFLPLPVAMGAAGARAKGKRIHNSHQFGVLIMDAYTFQ